jgi:hypothetical protein
MTLSRFQQVAALGFYLLTSGFLNAASKDSDVVLLPYEDEPAQRTTLISLAPPPQDSASTSIPHPVVSDIVIPGIARGYEDVYRRFVGGRLIYKPDPKSDTGRIDLPIRDLVNPLEGTFDLSRCGDSGKYLSISTGYWKCKKAENASKVEIWLTPRFLVERELSSTAQHISPIMPSWDAVMAPVGIFWAWGGWTNCNWYDYLVTESMDELGSSSLHEKYARGGLRDNGTEWQGRGFASSWLRHGGYQHDGYKEAWRIYVSFVN